MNKKFISICMALLSFGINTNAQDANSPVSNSYLFSYDDCLQYAFANSFERQNLKLSEKSAAEAVHQAKNHRLPFAEFKAGENAQHIQNNDINYSGTAEISTGIAIYQGGSISNAIKKSKQEEAEAELKTMKYDNSLSIEILKSYLNTLQNDETLKYKRSIVSTSKEQAEIGRKKYSVGAMLESDFRVLDAQYAANQTDTLDAHISMANSVLSLKKLLSMDADASLSLIAPDTTTIDALALLPNQEVCIERAMKTMPELKLSKAAIEIAKTQNDIIKAGYRPTISASAAVGTGHSTYDNFGSQLKDNFYQKAGITLSMPIFDRGMTKSKLAQNRIAKQQAELEYAQNEIDIKQAVIEQYQNIQLAYERYKMAKQRCLAYQKVFKVYNAKFDAGAIIITDLLQQQDNYINAINEYVRSKYSFILSRKVLDVYMGDNISLSK